MEFIQTIGQILLINILLSGDNAIVIAMASRNLPEHLQARAIRWGTFGAIALRIVFVFLMIYLLKLPFIQLIGGFLLLYVAYKLLVDKQDHSKMRSGNSLREAINLIIFADVIMSLDNVLAIAAIADSDLLLVIAGIILSIPIILTASELILKLIQRFPIIIYIGAGVLAWTAGKMLLEEAFVQQLFASLKYGQLIFLNILTLTVLFIGKWRRSQLDLTI